MTAAKKGVARPGGPRDAKTTTHRKPTRQAQHDDATSVNQSGSAVGRPEALPVRPQGIPASLRALDRWVLWRYTLLEKSKQWTKVPHSAKTGRKIDATKHSNGVPYDEALKALQESAGSFDGLGFLLGDGIGGIDVDDCINERGKLDERGRVISDRFKSTYAEVSPSGRGFKAIVEIGDDEALASVGRNTGELEIYGGKRFFTITGDLLSGHASTVARLPAEFRKLAESVGARTAQRTTDGRSSKPRSDLDLETARELLAHLPPQWNDLYGDWLRVGMALDHEFSKAPEALDLWIEFSRRNAEKFEEGACEMRWPGFGRPVKDEVTMRTLLRDARATGWNPPANIAAVVAEFALDDRPGDPDDLSQFDLPAFPREAEYGILHDVIEAATATSEATRPGVAAATLAQFAARYGAAMGLDIGDERRTCTFYVLVVGRTAAGRKGTSAALPETLFEDVDLMLEAGWGDDLIGDAKFEAVPVPHLRMLTNASTGQGLIDAVRDDMTVISRNGVPHVVPGADDKRVLLALSEFGTVFSMSAIEANTLTATLRDAFDARPLQTNTKTNKVSATGAHVCILGHITQREFLAKTVHNPKSTEIMNGMLNRMAVMFSHVEKLVPRPVAVPEATRRALATRLAVNVGAVFDNRLSNHKSRRTAVFDMTKEAWAYWDDAYRQMQSRLHPSEVVASMLARHPLIVRTLAALLAAMNGERVVGIRALRAALAWGDYLQQSSTKVFVTLEQRREASVLRDDIRRLISKLKATGGEMKHRDLVRAYSKSLAGKRMPQTIEAMQAAIPPMLKVEGKVIRLLV